MEVIRSESGMETSEAMHMFEEWYLSATPFERLGEQDDITRRKLIHLHQSGQLTDEEVASIQATYGWQL